MLPSDLLAYFLQVPPPHILWSFILALILVICITIGNGTPNSSGNFTPSRIVILPIQLWILVPRIVIPHDALFSQILMMPCSFKSLWCPVLSNPRDALFFQTLKMPCSFKSSRCLFFQIQDSNYSRTVLPVLLFGPWLQVAQSAIRPELQSGTWRHSNIVISVWSTGDKCQPAQAVLLLQIFKQFQTTQIPLGDKTYTYIWANYHVYLGIFIKHCII